MVTMSDSDERRSEQAAVPTQADLDDALRVAGAWHMAGMSHLDSLAVAADELCLMLDRRAAAGE